MPPPSSLSSLLTPSPPPPPPLPPLTFTPLFPLSSGNIKRIDATTIEISELPIGKWTSDYKEKFLCRKCEDGTLKKIIENHTTNSVLFIITAGNKEVLDQMEASRGGLIAAFKLRTSIHTNNMHAFNAQGGIVRYTTPEEVINEHYPIRLEAYRTRKNILLRKYQAEEALCRNRSQFVSDILSGKLSILPGKGQSGARHEQEILSELRKSSYATSFELRSISGPLGLPSGLKEVEEEEESDGRGDADRLRIEDKGYSVKGSDKSMTTTSSSPPSSIDRAAYAYLLDLPLRSLTEERALALRRK